MNSPVKNRIVRIFLFSLACCSVNASAQQAYNIYLGNIHAHSSYSDGTKDSLTSGVKTPAQAYQFAKQSQHLDFLGISEHNHTKAGMKNRSNYARGIQQANQANQDGKFVALYGMEYGVITGGGHVLIYGIDQLIGWEQGIYDLYNPQFDYTALFKLIAGRAGSFATLAHPATHDFNDLKARPYDLAADQAICAVAITTGQFDSKLTDYSVKRKLEFYPYYTELLSKGYIVGPTMDHDNHNTTFGRHSASRTPVLAKSLTRAAITDAYRANRFYATQDWNARLSFTINSQPMGSYLKNEAVLHIAAELSDQDAGDKVQTIELLYGVPGTGQRAKVLQRSVTESISTDFQLPGGKYYYFFLKITQADGDMMVSSPIWAKN
jgi:hypothetical protein